MASRMRMIGSDKMIRQGEVLLIQTQADLDWWAPRQYRKTCVYFEGMRYYISDRKQLDTYLFQFELKAWQDNDADLPGHSFTYDRNWVLDRDAALAKRNVRGAAAFLTTMLSPLLGFLWHPLKEMLADSTGLEAESASFHSILVAGFTAVTIWIILPAWALIPEWRQTLFIVASLLAVDSIIRYHLYGKGSERNYGFFEWLFWLERNPRN